MFEVRESMALIAACVVSTFFYLHRAKLVRLPYWGLLMVSFGLLVSSLACSMIEELFWKEVLDFVQHLLAPLSVVLLAIWSWLTFVRHKESPA